MTKTQQYKSELVKYPRTPHLPWSDGITSDDKVIPSLFEFIGKRVIVTEKMDGENTTLYPDYIHARSLDGRSHESRDWVKQFWSTIKFNIPLGWRICGENLYAKHSIEYNDLPTYFMGFSIWNKYNECLCWDDTLDYFTLLGITPVPILYDGIFLEKEIKSCYNKNNHNKCEGYVLRLADKFKHENFRKSVAKYVRKNHIQTDEHWMFGQKIEANKLRNT